VPKEKIDDKAVLVYLKSKRAALDQAIAALEGKAGDSAAVLNGGGVNEEVQSDSFVGMNIATAGVKYLKMAGRPARTTEEVYNALTKGGLTPFTRASLATIMYRIHNQGGEIFRVSKGLWGLSEWYPNRPKLAKKKSKGAAEEKESVKEESKKKQARGARSRRMAPIKPDDFKEVAVKWLRTLRDAGADGLPTPQLAAALGYNSGRKVPFLAIKINKQLASAKMDPKTVYEGRRIGKEQRWFAKEKIEEAMKLLKV